MTKRLQSPSHDAEAVGSARRMRWLSFVSSERSGHGDDTSAKCIIVPAFSKIWPGAKGQTCTVQDASGPKENDVKGTMLSSLRLLTTSSFALQIRASTS